MQATDQLDADELFHLALKSSEKGDHNQAIVMLKRSLELKPDAKTQYILAAEHAEIGMYDRAAEEMEKATEMDNSLHTAYFQLGLLRLMLGRSDEALKSWENLSTLENNDPLCLFGSGMIALVNNELETAKGLLEEGLSNNHNNPALNNDIQNILNNIQLSLNSQNEQGSAPVSSKEEKSTDNKDEKKIKANPLFLASYDDKEEH